MAAVADAGASIATTTHCARTRFQSVDQLRRRDSREFTATL